MDKVPDDPKVEWDYYYETDDEGTYYRVYARLENENDEEAADGVYPDSDCTGSDPSCNYGGTSPNTTLPDPISEPTPGPTSPPSATPSPTPTSTPSPTCPGQEPYYCIKASSCTIPPIGSCQAGYSCPHADDCCCKMYCFLAGTMILKADGQSLSSVPIEQIKTGDEMLSFDSIGKIESAKAIQIHKARVNQFFVISTQNHEVKVTGEHPFFVGGGDFKKVKDLKVGEEIFVYCNGNLCKEAITDIKVFNQQVDVFNLTVGDNNTFFANDFAVHNKL
jgi:hypothetical protein